MSIIEEFEAHRQSGNGAKRRYPAPLRIAAVKYFGEQREVGRERSAIAAELGVHPSTVDIWRNAAQRSTKSQFVAVKLMPSAAAKPVVRIGAMQIEGLGIAELAELIRAVW